jgi:hypothetical protein
MKVIERIIDKISTNLSKFKLIDHIVFMIKLLRYLDIKPGYKIAILGKNSKGWIVTFWSAILGKMPIVIIDINEPSHRILDILNRNQVYVLFVDKDIYKDKLNKSFVDKAFYTGIINTVPYISGFEFKMELLYSSPKKLLGDNYEDWAILFNKFKKLKEISQLEPEEGMKLCLYVEDFKRSGIDLSNHLLELNEHNYFEDEDTCIVSFSPGVTESETYTIGKRITLKNFNIIMTKFRLSYGYLLTQDTKMSVLVNFSQWFPFVVGMSFIENVDLIYPNSRDAERIWVYDTVTFENMWREEFENIMQIPFYRNLFMLFPFTYRMYIKNRFYKVFGKNVKEVTILNCQVRDNIMYHLNKCNLPVSVTGGSVQSGYLSRYERDNIFNGIDMKRDERIRFIPIENSISHYRINLEDVERVAKSLPFVTNCIVTEVNKKFHAMIELDKNIYDVDSLENKTNNVFIFKTLRNKLNKELSKRLNIKDLISSFSFVNNILNEEGKNNGYYPKALNGMPKLLDIQLNMDINFK